MIAQPQPSFWSGKRVLLTGHTGFKGSWLSLWLQAMGASVHGFALDPPTAPAMFTEAHVADGLAAHAIGDVRDAAALQRAALAARPEIVFHLAAQPLVRESYRAPVETYATNVMGAVHLCEAIRQVGTARVVVAITSDKCYENKEWVWPYREDDPLGGRDPYSSSKACAELVLAAYRQSFLSGIAVATARAGNVIGGGDWAADRLIPDFLRACDAGRPLVIRSPLATRPWQHVLEPLSGYLILAERLWAEPAAAGAWNFGPERADSESVEWIVRQLAVRREGLDWRVDAGPQPHENIALTLDSSKARAFLGWRPRWPLATALDETLRWHDAWRSGADMRATSIAQIERYLTGDVEVAGPVA